MTSSQQLLQAIKQKTSDEKRHLRVLLKLSGEALLGRHEAGLDPEVVSRTAQDIAQAVKEGYQLCLVVGGGNIYRGLSGEAQGINRVTADHMGMLATIMNALALQNALENLSIPTRVMSAIAMPAICESYIKRRATRHLEKGRVVIFAAGTGNPYFTTDTAAALRASEMGCDVLLKGTKVGGVYSADPIKKPDAQFYPILSYMDVLAHDLNVMDPSAITLARGNNIPIIVFSILEAGNLSRVLSGQGQFSIISHTQRDTQQQASRS